MLHYLGHYLIARVVFHYLLRLGGGSYLLIGVGAVALLVVLALWRGPRRRYGYGWRGRRF